MTNKELYTRCLELSGMIKKYRNQFIALLPEVNKRELYHEHGMHSIYEFGAKLGCLSNDTIRKVLKLDQDLKDKPVLHKKFLNAEIGWSKLAVIAKIATPQNEKALARTIETLSKPALELMVKEQSDPRVALTEFQEILSIKFNPKTLAKLRVLKLNLEKQAKQPLTWNETLEIMLNQIEAPALKKPKFKRQALQQTNQLCAKCNKPAEHLHHQIPYSISQSHESIVPLCKAHHDLEHHKDNSYVNQKYQFYKRQHLTSAEITHQEF